MLALVICAGSCLTLTSCSGDEVVTKYKIGICQLMEHVALDAATDGFKQAIIDELGEDAVEFDVQNGQGDPATCSTIANQFVSDNVDLILANATPALQSAAAATADIPILGTSVTEYGVALDLKDFNACININIATPIESNGSIILISVNFITIAPIHTTNHPNTSSSI